MAIERELILASASPRRAEILATAGIPFRTRPAAVAETRRTGEGVENYVRRLATEKALQAVEGADELVLGADTTVVGCEQMLEKPADAADARRMLRLLSGKDHFVLTGICLVQGERQVVDAAATRVWFGDLSEDEIDAYVATGEPMDKAGAYAIQGLASKFIHRIDGCYWNVVGLPISMVYRHLQREFGWGRP